MIGAAEDQKIQEAARWLSQQGEHEANIINTIRQRFALSAWQAQEFRVGGGR